ncbi:SLBB domain-containing protein [Treponema primitia]|uniref:SLBB domain-containing protein n=1 Tax=Treponema primitia TaxID=88058 RepID=UPI0002555462|nr:SLBB domain-containing protein [Treponema primitia]
MKRIALWLLFVTVVVFAQESQQESSQQAAQLSNTTLLARNAQLAMSSADYRVTAGDVYTLAYAAGTQSVTYVITVDNSYRVRVSNLGVINAAGRTFQQLKTEVETVVSNNYPLSGAQLVITRPSLFKVSIAGEVNVAQEQTAWALARLSSLLDDNNLLTAYSSIRDITITSSSGQRRACDLFKAQRDGDLSQDPYLRPGDAIRINRIDRVVTITGSVERPGAYQLLPGENLSDLITRYASGLTPTADPSRVELVRFVDAEADSGDKLYLSKQNISENYPLKHFDAVMVPSIMDLEPVMFVEGAVQENTGQQRLQNALATAQSNASNRITVQFNQGENYASLLQRNSSWFTAISDTQHAYIIRGEERIPLNINPILYDSNYQSQYFVERNDVLIIPFRQYFVTVAGAVVKPDRYPYIPDRGWDYYVALAGGFVKERNSSDSVEIKDLTGRRMSKTDVITPETTITARTNAGLYYFNQYAPVITTILSIITTSISVALLIGR